MKNGETLNIDATATSSKGQVSINEFEYIVCSTSGYAINDVATVDGSGVLTAQSAGRATLIVVAKDALMTEISSVTNYFKYTQYIKGTAYTVIDILVADGTVENPYLIADATSFKAIADDIAKGNNSYHYELVNDINLNGYAMSFGDFSGTISSFQDSDNYINRYNVYGIMLNKSNPSLFTRLSNNDDNDLANLENIDFHININYVASGSNSEGWIGIGLVGENYGLIRNITIKIDGTINAKNLENSYYIGSIAAQNRGVIIIDNTELVGVEGKIVVKNSGAATIVLGGAIGLNTNKLVGANTEPEIPSGDGDVRYDVYYGNQGATVDVELQVTSAKESCIGGAIGHNNNGTVTNVYATGKVLGIDESKQLAVDNVGGLIGKNDSSNNITSTITTIGRDIVNINTVEYESDIEFQITNSYSSAIVMGRDNVGGAIGYDDKGALYKVYYEIYNKQESVKGRNKVGGLIGCANDSDLKFCYANNFAWDYSSSVEVYDIIGSTNVGGLIGYAKSSEQDSFTNETDETNKIPMNVVSSLASVNILADREASGLIGILDGYGAIYTAYYYGVIDKDIVINPITKMIKGDNVLNQIPYNNVYANINGGERLDAALYQGVGFEIDEQFNNGKPYIVYTYKNLETGKEISTNLVTIIPTLIQIDQALSDTYYTDTNGNIFKQNDDFGEYIKSNYKPNDSGEYVYINGQMIRYDAGNDNHKNLTRWTILANDKMQIYSPQEEYHQGLSRYTLIASLIKTGDDSGDDSDYRASALVLYYYQFKDMSGENALNDLYAVNTIDMHKIINDDGIEVLPSTFKRFNLKSSNNNVVTVLTGGKLLLKGEGQAIITLTSTINPSASASFVVIVRAKVLKFNLYSNANLREEYKVKNQTLNIVKNSSQLLYADYSAIVNRSSGSYECVSATNMEVHFRISYNGSNANVTSDTIGNYIKLNGTYKDGVYIIPYGTPITISVNEYVDGEFVITATPYIIVQYTNGDYSTTIRQPLTNYYTTIGHEYEPGYYDLTFKVVTKKGAMAINTNKTQLDMMPSDQASNLDVKISTDLTVDRLYFAVDSEGEVFDVVDPLNPTGELINCVDTLVINASYQNASGKTIELTAQVDEGTGKRYFDISNIGLKDMLQTLTLTLQLNEKSHYIDVEYRLRIKLYLDNGVSTTTHIDVKPQPISSIIALNYRMQQPEPSTEGPADEKLSFDKAYLSSVIRPGSTNIIVVDLAPSIAVYDYIEIVDTTLEDRILFQQVDDKLNLMDSMDTWVDSGIRLKKYTATTSKLYLIAKLPQYSTANITHTIKITAINKSGDELKTAYLNLEAVMYPTIEMIYAYPNGQTLKVNTNEGSHQKDKKDAELAVGVEAGIDVTAIHNDEGTLQGKVLIENGDIENDNYVKLEYSNDKYYLRFNERSRERWNDLIGKQIQVIFTASKELNGIIETCEATIGFNIRRMVVHSVSMDRQGVNGKLYGTGMRNLKHVSILTKPIFLTTTLMAIGTFNIHLTTLISKA